MTPTPMIWHFDTNKDLLETLPVCPDGTIFVSRAEGITGVVIRMPDVKSGRRVVKEGKIIPVLVTGRPGAVLERVDSLAEIGDLDKNATWATLMGGRYAQSAKLALEEAILRRFVPRETQLETSVVRQQILETPTLDAKGHQLRGVMNVRRSEPDPPALEKQITAPMVREVAMLEDIREACLDGKSFKGEPDGDVFVVSASRGRAMTSDDTYSWSGSDFMLRPDGWHLLDPAGADMGRVSKEVALQLDEAFRPTALSTVGVLIRNPMRGKPVLLCLVVGGYKTEGDMPRDETEVRFMHALASGQKYAKSFEIATQLAKAARLS